jgi:hypothetical protein
MGNVIRIDELFALLQNAGNLEFNQGKEEMNLE